MKLIEAINKKYPQYAGRIVDAWQVANNCPLQWSEINKAHLRNFADHLCQTLAQSSARTYCAMLRAVLNLHSDTHQLPNGWQDALTVRKDVSEHIYITEDEIQRLAMYRPTTGNEACVLRVFLLSCLTGARHSDAATFTATNISGDRLIYVSQKTKIRTIVPLSPMASRMLNEANNLFGRTGERVERPTISDNTYNTIIRKVCRTIGLTERVRLYQGGKYQDGEKWEFVASHTARRSFATNLYLRGADLYAISKMMGHSSVTMTEGYIVCGLRELPENVMSYFAQFV